MTIDVATRLQDIASEANACFARKEFDRAASLFGECLLQKECSEYWNDWATAMFFAGRAVEAEGGYRKALQHDARNYDAAENLGALLASQGRSSEALPFLETAVSQPNGDAKPSIAQLLSQCKAAVAAGDPAAPVNKNLVLEALTRSLTKQSLALDRALFRLATLPLEINGTMERLAASFGQSLGNQIRTVAGPQAASELPTLSLEEIFREDLATALLAPKSVDGNTSLLELIVLNTLLRKVGAKNAFEIGTFDGRTALNFAANIAQGGHVYTLDLPAADVPHTRFQLSTGDHAYALKASSGARFQNTPHAAQITQLYGDSGAFEFSPYHRTIDFVFIDGSHTRDYVLNDSRVALRLLRKEGGLILWHDYPSWREVADALHELSHRDPNFRGLQHIQETNLAYLDVRKHKT
jgi:predicted O-methyltransferase YrrM